LTPFTDFIPTPVDVNQVAVGFYPIHKGQDRTQSALCKKYHFKGDRMIVRLAQSSAIVGERNSEGNVGPHRIQRLSLDEYAALQQSVGEKVVRLDGFWWRRVRLCFYRPLVPFREFSTMASRLPASAWLGGVQHVVPFGEPANSTMSFLIFPDAGDYSLDKLRPKPRQQVRSAAERFTVRLLTDRTEFKEKAFPAYKSFHARTKYSYLAARLRKSNFDKWTDAMFDHGASLILGAFRGIELSAISIAHAVEDTLIYSTFFGGDEALRDHVSSLLLHTVRQTASQDGAITQVYAGTPKPVENRGIDEFLIRRGCRVVSKPAFMRLNPTSKMVLRCLMSNQYSRMRGDQLGPEPLTTRAVESSSAE
jgi:hypothetical protein